MIDNNIPNGWREEKLVKNLDSVIDYRDKITKNQRQVYLLLNISIASPAYAGNVRLGSKYLLLCNSAVNEFLAQAKNSL